VPEEIQVLRMIQLFEAAQPRRSPGFDGDGDPDAQRRQPVGCSDRLHPANPFYCGRVVFGRSRVKPDPRTGRRKRLQGIPPSLWATGQGRHEAIWTEEEFEEVQQETRRRRRRKSAFHPRTYQLTSLLHCVECDSIMARFRVGRRPDFLRLAMPGIHRRHDSRGG
jgi:hypothetical protein